MAHGFRYIFNAISLGESRALGQFGIYLISLNMNP